MGGGRERSGDEAVTHTQGGGTFITPMVGRQQQRGDLRQLQSRSAVLSLYMSHLISEGALALPVALPLHLALSLSLALPLALPLALSLPLALHLPLALPLPLALSLPLSPHLPLVLCLSLVL